MPINRVSDPGKYRKPKKSRMSPKVRRVWLLSITLLTLLFIPLGTLFLAPFLNSRPFLWVTFWTICFVLVMVVIGGALIDMLLIRREHSHRQVELDLELAQIVADAEAMAEAELKENSK